MYFLDFAGILMVSIFTLVMCWWNRRYTHDDYGGRGIIPKWLNKSCLGGVISCNWVP